MISRYATGDKLTFCLRLLVLVLRKQFHSLESRLIHLKRVFVQGLMHNVVQQQIRALPAITPSVV